MDGEKKGTKMAGAKIPSKKNKVQKAALTKNPKKAAPAEAVKSRKAEKGFPVVGIGASAGGLEALEGLFSSFSPAPGLAFVIIQHLDPRHRSMMASLLQKHTKMPVIEMTDGMQVEVNRVYLNPPNKDVVITNRTLWLTEPVPIHGLRLPIDHFFRSLAKDLGEQAICIVLSGTGSDGSLGLKAVKGEGGITLAQKIKQAKYAGMPQSAIDTGFVDLILPVEKIPKELIRFAGHPYLKRLAKKPSEAQRFADVTNGIFAIIRKSTGVDFTNYKQNTIRRRIERRMALQQIKTPDEYVRFLKENAAEVDLLYKDLLIKVTSFFRDAEAFKVVEKEVIPYILEHKDPGSPIRVWVPACATGEEAYSIAMLFMEGMERLKKHFEMQIFATDIDTEAVNFARQAVYLDNIVADVSAKRLDHFFTKAENGYKVKKQLREMVVFAAQNVVKDPPFSKLDLLSCRNMLIYMDALLQKKLLPIFHYTLNPDGFLLLGSSESVGEFTDCFTPVSLKWKIYKRKGVAIERRTDFHEGIAGESAAEVAKARAVESPQAELTIRKMAETVILENYAPTCVLVNNRYDILYVNGRTERFLSLPAGEPTYNILKMARDDVRFKLSTLLHRAFKEKKAVVSKAIPIRTDGWAGTFNLIVRPLTLHPNLGELAMVIFESKKPAARPPAESKKKPSKRTAQEDTRIRELEQELASTKEYLQTTVEELETSNEELKSTNEELQSTNEELQSTNEELETGREELQSTNEELETVNTELQNKIAEMAQATSDISNLLNSMDVAALFLDSDLNVKRFTVKIKELFNLIPTDVGRPIEDIVHRIKEPNLTADIRNVLTGLNSVEKEIETTDSRRFLMRIRPYQTGENVIDGAVITFADITGLREAEASAAAANIARTFSENIVAAIRQPLLILDDRLRVISANESFYRFFHTTQEDTQKKFIYELGSGQWNVPKLRQALEEVLPQNNKFDDFEFEGDFAAIGRKKMLLSARQIFQGQKGMQQILLAFEDVTGKS
jgi:two-component system CheB/CheR fusion protein